MEIGMNPQVQAQGATNRQQLRDLSQKFEAVMTSQMFKTMRDTVPDGGLVDTGNAGNIYKQMLDKQIATQNAQGGGTGLSKAIYSYLEQSLPSASGAQKPE